MKIKNVIDSIIHKFHLNKWVVGHQHLTALLFRFLIFNFFAFSSLENCAQSYNITNTFSTKEGLPSNHIYAMSEDSDGFLWIATDNGVSRFDGKYFKNFSIRDGITSSDVIQLLVDKHDTLWLNCFRSPPVFFNKHTQRFQKVTLSKEAESVFNNLLFLSEKANGEVQYKDGENTICFIEGKQSQIETNKLSAVSLFTQQGHEIKLKLKPKELKTNLETIHFIQNELTIDSVKLPIQFYSSAISAFDNNLFLIGNRNNVYRIKLKNSTPFSYSIDTLSFDKKQKSIFYSSKDIIIQNEQDEISIVDLHTLNTKTTFKIPTKTNCCYIDSKNNCWVGTLDRGLICYSLNGIEQVYFDSKNQHGNLTSLVSCKNGTIYFGDYYGKIYSFEKNKLKAIPLKLQDSASIIKKIICSKNDIITIFDKFYSINFKEAKSILYKNSSHNTIIKNVTLLNDSTLILATLKSLILLNFKNSKYIHLIEIKERVSVLAKKNNTSFYYNSKHGIELLNLVDTTSHLIISNKKINFEMPHQMLSDERGILWISTTIGTLYAFSNDTILGSIKEEMPENITSIFTSKNKVWLGSRDGILQINYQIHPKFSYNFQTITTSDGLASNYVADLTKDSTSLLALTENGISRIPLNYEPKQIKIKPVLLSVRVNQKQKPLALNYDLRNFENNITLELAGIDLTGHFKNFQYSIDHAQNWTNSISNTINFQLNSGSHTISIRAIDINNKINSELLEIQFDIQTVFYKSIWFWTIAGILTSAFIVLFLSQRKREQQRIHYEQQLALEKQRAKITADLHDDIGATLSSLQLNSAVAHNLILSKKEGAENLLTRIEHQAHELSDKIGDIVWSMKNSDDEFMSLSSRITNFTTEIFGATDINYSLSIDEDINKLIRDIPMRKNIVLITKEALNNCAKYSHAKQVSISIKTNKQKIYINIQDDGIGFDPNQKKGNGIANMRNRVKEHNGIIEFVSVPNHGTKISITLSLIP